MSTTILRKICLYLQLQHLDGFIPTVMFILAFSKRGVDLDGI